MQATAEASERLVCAVLAAQVAALRDRIDTGATVDVLWRTTDLLSRLSGLVLELARSHPAPDRGFEEQCNAALAAEAEISQSLAGLAFLEAQRHDVTHQMADCVATALERLAAVDGSVGARLSPDDLAALYVCEDQRLVHDNVTRRFGIDALRNPQQPRTEIGIREGTGK